MCFGHAANPCGKLGDTCNSKESMNLTKFDIAGWEEERSGPTGKSFRFVRACVRAVIVKWE